MVHGPDAWRESTFRVARRLRGNPPKGEALLVQHQADWSGDDKARCMGGTLHIIHSKTHYGKELRSNVNKELIDSCAESHERQGTFDDTITVNYHMHTY